MSLDQEGKILLFSPATERVFRCRAEEAIGGPCKRFLSEALCQALTEYVDRGTPYG